jgi:hypothetical protein
MISIRSKVQVHRAENRSRVQMHRAENRHTVTGIQLGGVVSDIPAGPVTQV